MLNKGKSFIEKSRKQRKKLYINLKNNIRKAQLSKGANFFTYNVIGNNTQWADIYFLSKKNGYFYNVTIETTKAFFHESLESIAMDEALKFKTSENKLSFKEIMNLQDKIIEDKLKEGSHFVLEGVYLLKDYSYGIGLQMTLNLESLTVENINKAIDDFLKNNEQEWTGEKFSYLWKKDISYSVQALDF